MSDDVELKQRLDRMIRLVNEMLQLTRKFSFAPRNERKMPDPAQEGEVEARLENGHAGKNPEMT
jgi:hypothetical protein